MRRIHDVLRLLAAGLALQAAGAANPDLVRRNHHGFVDLALERAFVYKEHAPSEVVPLEGDALDREKTARFSMLETLADHDDELMEQLLEDIQPPRDKVFDDLAKELRDGSGLPGADRLGDPHQRRAAAAEGVAPRGARHRRHRQAARPEAGGDPSPTC